MSVELHHCFNILAHPQNSKMWKKGKGKGSGFI